jgi:hypothetical protein
LLKGALLRVKDVDVTSNQIRVRGGRGDRDRVTMLPAALKTELGRHLDAVKKPHERDLQHGAGWVELPWEEEKHRKDIDQRIERAFAERRSTGVTNWDVFEDLLGNLEWAKATLNSLEKSRNILMHGEPWPRKM